ncbi:MAG: hypothetical protein AAFX03_00370 [Pseudomonadota bacterium]
MRDLRPDLVDLWRAPPVGPAVMFVAARSGEGTTSIAASSALIAAEHARRVAWLVDLDFQRNSAFRGFEAGFAEAAGPPGEAYNANLGDTPPCVVIGGGSAEHRSAGKLLTAHPILRTRLLVTRFRNERLFEGERAAFQARPAWWRALKRSADWIIVDAPALDRSTAALVAAGTMDAVFLVVSADRTEPRTVEALAAEIAAHGGAVAGVVLNRRRSDARFVDRISA